VPARKKTAASLESRHAEWKEVAEKFDLAHAAYAATIAAQAQVVGAFANWGKQWGLDSRKAAEESRKAFIKLGKGVLARTARPARKRKGASR